MVLGAVLVWTALSLFVWNQWEDRRAGKSADEILSRVMGIIENMESVGNAESAGNKNAESAGNDSGYPNPYDAEMTEAEIDGYYYIGCISIPVLDLELPVMSSWSYPQLRIAPCRYSGSVKTDDLVIAAHNYARHFGNIKNLSVGDAVYFTDMDGAVWAYAVEEIDILSPTAVEEMTDGGWDLTLFTCTYGGQSRVTVRCEKSNEP